LNRIAENEVVLVCESDCLEGERKCKSEKLFQFCEEVEPGCFQWSEVKHCGVKDCADGICHMKCVPDCVDKQCGTDGCGGSCGQCLDEQKCQNWQCVPKCVSNCEFDGQSECIGEKQNIICQQVETEPVCLQWGNIGTCFDGYVCLLIYFKLIFRVRHGKIKERISNLRII